jgi:hypothetical protein
MKIKYVDYAIANNFGTHIELNKNLREYPELHDAILSHELSHTDNPGFTKEDFLLDLSPGKVNYWKLYVWMMHNPKSFLQFMPVYKKDDTFIYDINMIIAYSFVGLAGAIGLYLAFK